jgi:capsular exopolysaccharide synthesis family protein
MLRTNLRLASGSSVRTLAITSAEPKAGKSVVSANLGLALAQQGYQVLVVDADLRRPALHRVFGAELGPGLCEVLRGEQSLPQVIQELWPGMSLVSAGTMRRDAPELLGSQALPGLIAELRSMFDVVIIDTPPVLAVTDAALISAATDATLLVVRASQTDRNALAEATARLRHLKVPLMGVVMSDVRLGPGRRYGYYGYGSGGETLDSEDRTGMQGIAAVRS